MSKAKRLLTSDLKPAYVFGLVMALLFAASFVMYFVDFGGLPASMPWRSSKTPAAPSPAVQIGKAAPESGSSSPGSAKSDQELSGLLPGRWTGGAVMFDNSAGKQVTFDICNTLFSDGRFESITHVSDGKVLNYSGKWRVEGGAIVWDTLASDDPSFKKPYTEANTILELMDSTLRLQEKGFHSKWARQ